MAQRIREKLNKLIKRIIAISTIVNRERRKRGKQTYIKTYEAERMRYRDSDTYGGGHIITVCFTNILSTTQTDGLVHIMSSLAVPLYPTVLCNPPSALQLLTGRSDSSEGARDKRHLASSIGTTAHCRRRRRFERIGGCYQLRSALSGRFVSKY